MRRTYKFRLYTTRKNKRLHRTISAAGRIWNHCVAFQRTYYRITGKYCSKAKLQSHIAKLRKRRDDWLQVGSQAVQKIVERLDDSYQRFFKWKKGEGPKHGRPGFKKSREYTSFTLTQAGWKLLGGHQIRIGNHVYKFIQSREIEGVIKTVTVKRDKLNRLWLCFSVLQAGFTPPEFSRTGNAGGFDFGLKTYLTADDGKTIISPQFLRRGMRKIASLNRQLSRKQKGGSNRWKAKRRLAREHIRIANRRRDWCFKEAHALCDAYTYT